MKKFYISLIAMLAFATSAMAQGWPSNYAGVMLQGFYWDSFEVTNWQLFTQDADRLSTFDLIWIPNTGTVNGGSDAESMGYMPDYWLRHTSKFGTEDELRNMIDVFRAKGTGFIEDVVINHKSAMMTTDKEDSPWYRKYLRFRNENKNGYSIQWDNKGYTGITKNDDVPGGGNYDTGDGFDGARDLDHTNAIVQKNCKTYQQFLLQDIGYVGFRLDMVKGYGPKYTGIYNAASQPEYSVGEYWDGYDAITGWIQGTSNGGKIQSGAFDFPFKFAINDAFAGGDWGKLSSNGVILDPYWRRYAVTFVDNHDTRRENTQLSTNREDANVLILALPGTPCVLIEDFNDYETTINKMIDIRRTVGITNTSEMSIITWDNNKGIQFDVTGRNGNLRIDLGDAVSVGAPAGMKLALSTKLARVYISSGLTTGNGQKDTYNWGKPFFSKTSGTYAGPLTVKIGPSVRGAKFVYTTDGSNPTPNSNPLTTTTDLTLERNTTIIAGIVENGAVTKLAKQDYIITDALPEKITVYVKSGAEPTLYAWDAEGEINGTWPGTKMTATKNVGGVTWYVKEFNKKDVENYVINAIFNNGAAEGAIQTPDINDIASDIFYTFDATTGAAKDVTALYLNALYNPTVSIDKASGEYPGAFKANITSSNPESVIVYTTDGTQPSASNGTQATGKATVDVPANSTLTLTAGLLIDGAVKNIVSATYTTGNEAAASGIDIYVDAPVAPYLYTWNEAGEHNGTWPGNRMSATTTIIDGVKWYHQHFDLTTLNIIFNKGEGGEGNQTADINGLTEGEHFYTYDGGGNYTDVTGEHVKTNANIPACATWVDNGWFLYFENNGGYVDPYAWIWGDNYAQFTGTEWPGTELVVQVGTSGNGNPVYRWTYANTELTPTGIVFSDNGAPQTSDFPFVNGGYYTVNGLVGTVEKPEFNRGDLNHDGNINAGDISTLYDLILKGEYSAEADLNNDGNVNAGDISALYDIILNAN